MSQVSKLISVNNTVNLLKPMVPNDYEIEPRSIMFFQIPMADCEPPLRILVQNNDGSEFIRKLVIA